MFSDTSASVSCWDTYTHRRRPASKRTCRCAQYANLALHTETTAQESVHHGAHTRTETNLCLRSSAFPSMNAGRRSAVPLALAPAAGFFQLKRFRRDAIMEGLDPVANCAAGCGASELLGTSPDPLTEFGGCGMSRTTGASPAATTLCSFTTGSCELAMTTHGVYNIVQVRASIKRPLRDPRSPSTHHGKRCVRTQAGGSAARHRHCRHKTAMLVMIRRQLTLHHGWTIIRRSIYFLLFAAGTLRPWRHGLHGVPTWTMTPS